MIRHAKQFRLFADIEVIAEILRIVFAAHFVDPCRQKFACTVGCYLMQYVNITVCKKFSRSTFLQGRDQSLSPCADSLR